MNRLSVTIWLVLLLSSGITIAVTPDTTYRVMKDTALFNTLLKNYNAELSTIECDFVQLKYMSILKQPVESYGRFCYKNGMMIRWEYTEPFKYLIIINNGRMFVKDEEKINSFDLTASESFNKLNTMLGKIVNGRVLDDKNDFLCNYFENDLNYKLVLYPKSKDLNNFFREIVLYFGKELFSVARVQMKELSGDKTDILFNNRKINHEIPEDKFIPNK
ncbi:MAG TPA: outer membrane lipoprotein carrier protein LolA [Bacteroidales bacterium]|nr:outer membrane lipoprotein carrier protein LolA [Bacteroidales bacterium]